MNLTDLAAKIIMESEPEPQLQTATQCLGCVCDKVFYKPVEGSPVLWCAHVERKVIDMEECPEKHWSKSKQF